MVRVEEPTQVDDELVAAFESLIPQLSSSSPPPTRAELEALMVALGIDDPREMMRTGEDAYGQLALADADRDELLDAIVEHPILLQRPIVVRDGRAVIGRPPEAVRDLF